MYFAHFIAYVWVKSLLIIVVFLYSHFNLVLESTHEQHQRNWLLRRIRESHQEYLELMEEQRRRLERQNANMVEALTKIRAMDAKK